MSPASPNPGTMDVSSMIFWGILIRVNVFLMMRSLWQIAALVWYNFRSAISQKLVMKCNNS